MSTPASKVKAAIEKEKVAVLTALAAAHVNLSQRVSTLETEGRTWYEKHLVAVVVVAVIVGAVLDHLFR